MTASPLALRRIVVADDDEDMRLYLRGCLRAFGVDDVLEAADGEAALLLAHEPGVELVMADLRMPGLDGEALCRALHADAATAAIPVLLISGEADAQPACADRFLAKPFNATRLRAHIASLL